MKTYKLTTQALHAKHRLSKPTPAHPPQHVDLTQSTLSVLCKLRAGASATISPQHRARYTKIFKKNSLQHNIADPRDDSSPNRDACLSRKQHIPTLSHLRPEKIVMALVVSSLVSLRRCFVTPILYPDIQNTRLRAECGGVGLQTLHGGRARLFFLSG